MHLLIRDARAFVFQVGGRHLGEHRGRRAEAFGDAPYLAFDQATQWRQVAGAVTELGEEAHHRFGSVVGADHQTVAGVGHGVLGQHAHARLGVAEHEVAARRGQFAQLADLLGQAGNGRGDVDGLHFIRINESQRGLGVGLVVLHVVRQTNGDKTVVLVLLLSAQLLHRQLGQTTSCRGIHAAADAEHQHLGARSSQGVLDEGNTFGDLGVHVGVRGERGDHAQGFGDFSLAIAHEEAP